MAAVNIDLWVSGGSFDAPYYQFYTNAAGTEELTELSLDTDYTYTFRRLGGATSHPFYLSDTGFKEASTDAISINGNGSPSAGITGDQAFTVSFNENAGDIVDLLYYCTSHSSMQGNIQLMEAYPAAPIIRGNSLYTIVDGPLWTEAETNSQNLGGHLVTINNAEENAWLAANESIDFKGKWIGYYQDFADSGYRWISGEESTYSNWAQGFPDFPSWEFYAYLGTLQWFDARNDGYGNMSNPKGIAEIPFIRRGDSAYVIVEGPTWEEAEANAVALGGHLVTINDAEENEWLIDNYLAPNTRNYFIGATDQNSEGIWSWASGEALGYSNWYPGEPNNADGGEDFSVISGASQDSSRFGFWNDTKGLSPELGIAEIPLAPNHTPTGTPTLSSDFKVGQTISIDASAIEDADNFEGWTPTYEYSWEVSNDNGTTWSELASTDATDGDDSYTLTSAEVGKQLRGVVSYLDGYGTNEVVESDASLVTPVIRGNSLYSIVDGPSWTQAEANSVKLGGHLISVKNENENRFISHAIKGEASRINLWIGLEDADRDSEWQWTSGEEYIYNNWGFQNQPGAGENRGSTPNGTEDYVSLILHGEYGNRLGDWNTLPESTSLLHPDWQAIEGIAEIPFIRRGDSAYVIVEGPTWEEAEANAVALGGHLVTINDAEENEWLHQSFDINQTLNAHLADDGLPLYWAGFKQIGSNANWEWVSGEESSYVNWGPFQPNHPSEIYLHLGWNENGEWNDFSSNLTGQEKWLDNHLGIAEIPLAPNNAPSETPTLSGDFKVGQTISIDASAIDDADNFEGWTPTYEYSWEVSNDNGTTWSELASTDATDGDDSYTLTSAEVGKQLRGVVSYLDGYGTNEVVESDASLVTPVIRGNSLYSIVDGPSWTQAEANSVKLGGHLISVKNENENRFISHAIKGEASRINLWIGLEDADRDSEWQWTSGEEYIYNNWGFQNQPGAGENRGSTPNGTEDYVSLILHGEYGNRLGDWNTLPESTSLLHPDWQAIEGIAEIPFIRRGDSAYVIVEGPTWEEAEANAVALGGHLVTINDADENDFVVDLMNKVELNDNLTQPYIGLTDRHNEGTFVWSSGQHVLYTNWDYGQPNAGHGHGEDYTMVRGETMYGSNGAVYPLGTWVDITNNEGRKGIAEIPLAPNNTPTGTPELTGDFKVGQTISIDASEIEDADNFEGWTPSYEYSWEVSGDNGTTWTVLNSSDATDGDSTFTLTSAEVGKQLRGVVSYLDGHGTNESVLSQSNLIKASSFLKITGSPKIGEVVGMEIIDDGSNIESISQYGWEFSPVSGTVFIRKSDIDFTDNTHTYKGQSVPFAPYGPDSDEHFPMSINGVDVNLFDNGHWLYAGLPGGKSLLGSNKFTNGFAVKQFYDREDSIAFILDPKIGDADGLVTFSNGVPVDSEGEYAVIQTDIYPELFIDAGLGAGEIRAYANVINTNGQSETIYSQPVDLIAFDQSGWDKLEKETKSTFNNSPDGLLDVQGSFLIGQTITLDNTSITDEDGIDSAFTYSWQVFDGNTDIWFDRTTPDATDGDASYTLTNDDEDELLRAQVSYVDGNGLTEIISSEPFLVRPAFIVPEIYQAVTTRSEEIAYRPGGSIHLPLIYNVSTGDANLSGLTLNVHYDSTLLAPEGADHGVSEMIDAAISTTADLADVDDLDNDPMTDRMVQLVWGSFDNSFPDQDLPLQIANVSFESLEDPSVPVDSLTGSRINFTASGTASGYDFLPSTTTLTPRGFDLDVDGDGEVTALGDGLMIIRKLFGPAFAGDKLTDKAISPDATRTTEEIHEFIQDGINAGDLDVDQDGNTTALGDGLMVIRRLFGPAFAGDKLIDKAISPDSPFLETFNPAAWVGYEIDKLNPILPEVVAPQNPITAPEYGVGIGDDPIVVPLYGVGIGISDPSQLSPTA